MRTERLNILNPVAIHKAQRKVPSNGTRSERTLSTRTRRRTVFIIAALLGCIVVLGPLALHMMVERALVRKISRTIENRTGSQASIKEVWPTGIFRPGFKLKELSIHWRESSKNTDGTVDMAAGSLRIPTIRGYLKAYTDESHEVVFNNAVLKAAGTREGLSRLLQKLKRPQKNSAETLSSGTAIGISLNNFSASIQVKDGPIEKLAFHESNLTLKKCVDRDRVCHNAHLGKMAITMRKGIIIAGKDLSWRSFSKAQVRQQTSNGEADTHKPGTGKKVTWQKGVNFHLDHLYARALSVHLPGELGGFSLGPKGAQKKLLLALKVFESGEDLLDVSMALNIRDGEGGTARLHGFLDLQKEEIRLNASLKDLSAEIFPLSDGVFEENRTTINGGIEAVLGPGNKGSAGFKFHVTANTILSQNRIARQPIPLEDYKISVKGKANWNDSTGAIAIPEMIVEKNKVKATLRGRFRRNYQETEAHIEGSIPPTSCQSLLDAIPVEMAPKLQGMVLAGELGGKIAFGVHSSNLDGLSLSLNPVGKCTVVKDPPQADVNKLLKPYVLEVKTAEKRFKKWSLGSKNPHFQPLHRLPDHLTKAFLTTEDQEFFNHKGFDLEQIKRALAFDLKHRGFYKGASTISQQLVKNVFLNHNRTLSRKLQETVLTWRMEQVVSKKRILELYLNVIEMGPGIYGVSRASRVYFGRPAAKLTPLQSLHLAAITPNPVRYYKNFKGGRIDMAWLLRLRDLLGLMHRHGHISSYTYKTMKNKELIMAAF